MAEIDEHIGVAMSGLTADARTLIDHGRVETQQHRFTYNEPMPLESVTQVPGACLPDCAWRARCCAARLCMQSHQTGMHVAAASCYFQHPTVHPPCCHRAPCCRCPLQSLCDLALRFGEDDEGEGGMSRPFGVALLVAGWDVEGGPVL